MLGRSMCVRASVGVSGRLLRPSRVLLSSQEQVKVTHSHTHTHNEEQGKRKKFFDDASSLQDFLASSPHIKTAPNPAKRPVAAASPAPGDPLSVFIETYGCQMNASDSEIVRSVLLDAGHSMSDTLEDADVIVANTCAIRDNAEAKVWHRLNYFKSLKAKNRVGKSKKPGYPLVGVLGCMAERLKTSLLEEESVDFVCGPDAYRDVPLLVEIAATTDQKAANVQLSLEETYADISPVRQVSSTSAFVSIMRGCNNMCAYCIVPFTRGRERSRDIASILQEVADLSKQGVKEVVLLGQNVNSYHDTSVYAKELYPAGDYESAEGFSNMYRKRDGAGARFSDLLAAVAAVDPEVRIRFTSPHPKDFPDSVLEQIAHTPNICKNIHMPAQSGSSKVLAKMRRGYTREVYDQLISRVREKIPDITISSDFISGFCSETEEDHLDTLSLLESVQYEQAFMFAYSMREKTHAQYKLTDDVSEPEKLRRLQEVIATFRKHMVAKNQAEQDSLHLVLVEGPGRKSSSENPTWTGRTDGNKRCIFSADVQLSEFKTEDDVLELLARGGLPPQKSAGSSAVSKGIMTGDYVVVRVEECKGQTLYCRGVGVCSLTNFHKASERLLDREKWLDVDQGVF